MAEEKAKKTVPIETRFKSFVSQMDPITEFQGRESEIEELKEIFNKKRMRSVMILGEAGVGKTALVRRMASILRNEARFRELNVGGLLCDTHYRGEFENKIVKMMKAVKEENRTSDKPYVFFVDEAHLLVGAGQCEHDNVDASNLMKQYLADGSLIVWGATTMREYMATIKNDPAFARRFSVVVLDELDDKTTIKILNDFSEGSVEGSVLEYVLAKSKEIKGGHQPDISIELLDRCMARRKANDIAISDKMIDGIADSMSKYYLWENDYDCNGNL